MTRIVINKCYGGFGLSQKALRRLIELGASVQVIKEEGWKDASDECMIWDISLVVDNDWNKKTPLKLSHYHKKSIRTDKRLVQVVEELREEANDMCANLKVVDIPDDVEWEIEEYDGNEWVSEKHKVWN